MDGKNPRWKCLCECGKETVAYAHNLLAGRHKSCGCWRQGPTARGAVEKTTQNGYVFVKVPGHPRAHKQTGRVREHIIVMEQILGRHLLPGEEVHHKNRIRSDNRPENLELWNTSHPAGARLTDLIAWAEELLKLYAPTKLS